jgi:hypothetical protein
MATDLIDLKVLHDEAIKDAILKLYSEGTVYQSLGSVLLKINPYPNIPIENQLENNVELMQMYFRNLKGITPHHIYRLAEDLRRNAAEIGSQKTVVFRGSSGSGKSESLKQFLQYLIFIESNEDNIQIAHELDLSRPLGSYNNPILISPDASPVIKKLYANYMLLEYFTSSSIDSNPNASRCYKYIRLQYNQHGKLNGFRMFPACTELMKYSNKDSCSSPLIIQTLVANGLAKAIADGFLLNQGSIRDNYTVQALPGVEPTYALEHLRTILLDYGGLSQTDYDNFLKVIAVIIHLQSIMLLATETATISSGTKNAIAYAEQLLGIPGGQLGPLILKKPDDRLGGKLGGNMSNMVETKPVEAKLAIDFICQELLTRLLYYACDTLAVNMPPFFTTQATTLPSSDQASPRKGVIHLVDTIGVERVPALPPGTSSAISPIAGSYSMLTNHYFEEKWYEVYIQEVFQKEFQRYAAAGIELADPIPIPDVLPFIELYEKPGNNLLTNLDETCAMMNQNTKIEDKVYVEKLLLLKNKQIKNGGSKIKKQTIFLIRHSFQEVMYDCESFYMTHKFSSLWSNNILTGTGNVNGNGFAGMFTALHSALQQSTIRFLGKDEYANSGIFSAPTFGPNSGFVSALPKPPAPGGPPGAPPPPKPTAGGVNVGIGIANAQTQNYSFHKQKLWFFKFLQELSVPVPTLVPPFSSNSSSNSNPAWDLTTTYYGENQVHFVYCIAVDSFGSYNLESGRVTIPMQYDWIIAQSKLACIEGLIKLAQQGYGAMVDYPIFYSSFRALLPYTFKAPSGSRSTLPPSLPPLAPDEPLDSKKIELYRVACEALLQVLIKIVPVLSLHYPNFSAFVVFTPQGIFFKSAFYSFLSEYRYMAIQEMANSSTKIIATYRKFKAYQSYQQILIQIILLQCHIRRFVAQTNYRKLVYYGKWIKRKLLVRSLVAKYQTRRNAGLVIKNWFAGNIRYLIRYRCLQRATRAFHRIARGLIIRKQSMSIYAAMCLIQRVCTAFLRRIQFIRARQRAVALIQRVYRGSVERGANSKIVKILRIRKEQRIAEKVTKILQSIWRKKLVQMRFRALFLSAAKIQSGIRRFLQYREFKKARKLALWLQSHGRRLKAFKSFNLMKVSMMVSAEKGSLSTQLVDELSPLMTLHWSQCSLGSYFLSKYHMKRIQQLLLVYDFAFDLSIAYPHGWLRTLLSFATQLHARQNRRIRHVTVGSQHTIIVDDQNDVYAMGLGDLGQLGLNNRHSYTTPKLIESMEGILAHGEQSHGLASAKGNKGATSLQPRQSSTIISLNSRVVILDICCGRDHTLIRTNTGRVYSWGDNRRGQLGHSDFESSAVPRIVIMNEELKALQNVTTIACGAYHSA